MLNDCTIYDSPRVPHERSRRVGYDIGGGWSTQYDILSSLLSRSLLHTVRLTSSDMLRTRHRPSCHIVVDVLVFNSISARVLVVMLLSYGLCAFFRLHPFVGVLTVRLFLLRSHTLSLFSQSLVDKLGGVEQRMELAERYVCWFRF